MDKNPRGFLKAQQIRQRRDHKLHRKKRQHRTNRLDNAAKHTAIPAGVLCRVTANTIMVVRSSLLFGPSA